MLRVATTRMRSIRRLMNVRKRMEIGPGSTSWAMSHHALRGLRGFASSEKVLPSLAPPLPSYHSAPSALPSATSSAPPVPAPSEPPPTVTVIDAPATAVPAPRVGTSPAPRALVPFHAESSLWPYPRAPLDDRDDIVELDFAVTSALSDVDAFERRRQHANPNLGGGN